MQTLHMLTMILATVAGQPGDTGAVPAVPATAARDTADAMSLRHTPALQVANAYGFAEWNQVERIDFTFNVKPPGKEQVTRAWSWWPKEQRVQMTQGESKTWSRADPSKLTEQERAADAMFINDSYWLLFPFQLVWSSPNITDAGQQPLPIGEGSARKLTAQYPQQGGYTPGDAYDVYLDDQHRIVQWMFRRGGAPAEQGGLRTTWEKSSQVGPIVVSMEHFGPERENGFHLWFTDVRVTVRDAQGQTAVHEPRPLEE